MRPARRAAARRAAARRAAALLATALLAAGCTTGGASLQAAYNGSQPGGPVGGTVTTGYGDVVSALVSRVQRTWALTATIVNVQASVALVVTGLRVGTTPVPLRVRIPPGSNEHLSRLALPGAFAPPAGGAPLTLQVELARHPALVVAIPVQG